MSEIITCPVCKTTGHKNEFDTHPKGVWCPNCLNFIWNNPNDNHQHKTLILEQKTSSAVAKEVYNIPKLNKQLSPLRYPGGKSKMIDYMYTKLQKNKCDTLVEVFAGGCSFGLSLLDAGVINHLVINDNDKNLIAFWNEAINNPEALINKLTNITPTHNDYNAAKALLSSNAPKSPTDVAWAYLLVNRLSYSGIQKAGCMGGKNGTNKALLSRYNPDKLIAQIKQIASMKNKITIHNWDYTECIENYYWDDKTTLFIDPPYYQKGKQLYINYFTKQDHAGLSELIINLTSEFPDAANILITYDDTEYIENLYWFIEPTYLERKYSI